MLPSPLSSPFSLFSLPPPLSLHPSSPLDPSSALFPSLLPPLPQEVRLMIPNCQRMNRGNYVMSQLVQACKSNDVTDLLIVHEHRGEPSKSRLGREEGQTRARHCALSLAVAVQVLYWLREAAVVGQPSVYGRVMTPSSVYLHVRTVCRALSFVCDTGSVY